MTIYHYYGNVQYDLLYRSEIITIPPDVDVPDLGDVIAVINGSECINYFEIISQPRWNYDIHRYVVEVWSRIPVVDIKAEQI